MLEKYIARLVAGQGLSEAEAHEAMGASMAGQTTDAQIAGFLVALRIKGETLAVLMEFTTSAAMKNGPTPRPPLFAEGYGGMTWPSPTNGMTWWVMQKQRTGW